MNKPVEIDTARVEPVVSCRNRRGGRHPHLGKSWLIAGLLSLAVLAAIGVAWWLATAEAPVRYTTAPVTRGAVTRAVTATGTVNPVLTIIVGSYVSGVIQEINCDYNTEVKKGQICAKIDPRPYQTVVDQNKANLASAKAQLEKDKANLAYAQLNYDRNGTAGADQCGFQGYPRQCQEWARPGARAGRRRRGHHRAAPGAARRRASQSRLHQHRFAGGRHRRVAQRHRWGRPWRRASRRRHCS